MIYLQGSSVLVVVGIVLFFSHHLKACRKKRLAMQVVVNALLSEFSVEADHNNGMVHLEKRDDLLAGILRSSRNFGAICAGLSSLLGVRQADAADIMIFLIVAGYRLRESELATVALESLMLDSIQAKSPGTAWGVGHGGVA